jgi:hypothetical protein
MTTEQPAKELALAEISLPEDDGSAYPIPDTWDGQVELGRWCVRASKLVSLVFARTCSERATGELAHMPTAQAARELGVPERTVSRWRTGR